MIVLEDVTKKYGHFVAVDHISLTVPKGKIVGLLGQNGAGKTTLLNMMTGYIGPSQGRISIGGNNLFEQPRTAKRLLGYLPEHPPLYEEMTVKEYLAFCCRLKEVEKSAIADHLKEIAATTGIEQVMGRVIGNLSKGYRQRVGIAQALCGTPEVLIFDEPTVGLDPKQLTHIRELIKSLGEKHTIVFSSHILPEVQALCEEVYIIHRGKLIKKVYPKEIDGGKKKTMLLEVVIAMAPEELLPCLQSLSAIQRIFPSAAVAPGITQATLECKKNMEAEKQLFTLLSGLGVPILRLNPLEDTLEEVFLRATSLADAKEDAENK
ncbi:MAG: ABC transporter ATP-binding protein [Clostridiales bacterium]|nr:ABC transporter ATP-binding protein [Clostridiales bacterium]